MVSDLTVFSLVLTSQFPLSTKSMPVLSFFLYWFNKHVAFC